VRNSRGAAKESALSELGAAVNPDLVEAKLFLAINLTTEVYAWDPAPGPADTEFEFIDLTTQAMEAKTPPEYKYRAVIKSASAGKTYTFNCKDP
jgi:hypothetical protein